MADGHAQLGGKGVEHNLTGNKEKDTKGNVAQGPAVLEGAGDEEHLHDHVDKQLHGVEQVEDDKQANGVGGREAGPAHKGANGDEKGNGKGNERAGAQQPHGQRGAVLVELEADEAVDEQAGDEGAGQTTLQGGKVRIRRGAGRDDTGVDNEREEGEQHVEVEEGENLPAADGGKLGADVQNHDDGHEEGKDVGGRGGGLKDDGVGELNVAGKARRLDADVVDGLQHGPDRGTEGERRILADPGEISKGRHDGGSAVGMCFLVVGVGCASVSSRIVGKRFRSSSSLKRRGQQRR